MQATTIEWADWAWNPTRGCSRISPGCVNCYAEKMAARFSSKPCPRCKGSGCGCPVCNGDCFVPGPFSGFAEFRIIGDHREAHWTGRVELIEAKLLEPLSSRKKALRFAQEHGRKPRVFVNSMSDLFHAELPSWDIARVFATMTLCQEINFLVLTKRADRMPEVFTEDDFEENVEMCAAVIIDEIIDPLNRRHDDLRATREHVWPIPNVWLGVSVEDQKRADERIPHLLRTPAAVRFLSCEPLLQELRLWKLRSLDYHNNTIGYETYPLAGMQAMPDCDWPHPKIDWVICGGESGMGARPFDLAWARSLRDQCKEAGVPFFMKQLGRRPEETVTAPRDWQRAVPLKDKKGGDPAEWPEDLRIQEVPNR